MTGIVFLSCRNSTSAVCLESRCSSPSRSSSRPSSDRLSVRLQYPVSHSSLTSHSHASLHLPDPDNPNHPRARWLYLRVEGPLLLSSSPPRQPSRDECQPRGRRGRMEMEPWERGHVHYPPGLAYRSSVLGSGETGSERECPGKCRLGAGSIEQSHYLSRAGVSATSIASDSAIREEQRGLGRYSTCRAQLKPI